MLLVRRRFVVVVFIVVGAYLVFSTKIAMMVGVIALVDIRFDITGSYP